VRNVPTYNELTAPDSPKRAQAILVSRIREWARSSGVEDDLNPFDVVADIIVRGRHYGAVLATEQEINKNLARQLTNDLAKYLQRWDVLVTTLEDTH
jgi:hypothetical protein